MCPDGDSYMKPFTFTIDMISDCRYTTVLTLTAPRDVLIYVTSNGKYELMPSVKTLVRTLLRSLPENHGMSVADVNDFYSQLAEELDDIDETSDRFNFLSDAIETE